MALAVTSDVEALAGRALTANESTYAPRLLDMATAVVQTEVRQTLSAVPGDTYSTTVEGRLCHVKIPLPERPVTAVSLVTLNGVALDPATYTFVGKTGILSYDTTPSCGDVIVVITYDHGFATVPSDIASIVAGLAWSQIVNPQGLRQFGIGDYTGTFAGDVVSAGLALSSDQKDILKRYGRNTRSFRMCR